MTDLASNYSGYDSPDDQHVQATQKLIEDQVAEIMTLKQKLIKFQNTEANLEQACMTNKSLSQQVNTLQDQLTLMNTRLVETIDSHEKEIEQLQSDYDQKTHLLETKHEKTIADLQKAFQCERQQYELTIDGL